MSTQRQQQYPGSPLDDTADEIRLLKLYPGSGDDPLHCSLHNVPSSHITTAEALSYAWGEPPATHMIWVNDFEFDVRSNLYHALQKIRLPDQIRTLWIDALCINQSDVQERNHQVRQMAHIFGSAKSVIVWLGLANGSTSAAFDFLKQSYMGGQSTRKRLMNDARWHAISELCRNDYWTRVWIVQEIGLGKNVAVVCGDLRVPWQYITELRKVRKHVWPQYQSHGERTFMRSLPAKIDQQKELRATQGCVLWTLMESFRNSQCQDYHDKVYGFLGLSTDCDGDLIVVDYTKSVADLHTDVLMLYFDLFMRSGQSPHTPQLVSLSEFLHTLLPRESHYGVKQDDIVMLEHQVGDLSISPSARSGARQPFELIVSATEVYTIMGFSADLFQAVPDLGLIHEFLEGTIPYSHLGHWRNHLDSHVERVRTFENANAFIRLPRTLANVTHRPTETLQRGRPALFRAKPQGSRSKDESEDIYGIAPAGVCEGDLIHTFIESDTALIFQRPDWYKPKSSRSGTTSTPLADTLVGSFRGGREGYLIGRAFVLDVPGHRPNAGLRLARDKSVESSKRGEEDNRPWLMIAHNEVHIDVHTLQQVTATKSNWKEPSNDRVAIDLMPTRVESSLFGADRGNDEIRGRELDLEGIRLNPPMQKFTLGPAYAPIANPASLGYMCNILQIFFILRPVRNTILRVLRPAANHESKVADALYDLFWHLRYRSLPADPIPLTVAFGWKNYQIHEQQDLFEFYRVFSQRLEQVYGTNITEAFKGRYRITLKPGELEFSESSRVEEFYDFGFNPDKHYLLKCIEDDFLYDEFRSTIMRLSEPPDVFLMQMRFFKYDVKQDKMIKWGGNFEYPPEIDLKSISEPQVKDTEYQLHAVCVLEDTNPVPRYLLYLRPRLEDQWILFFKDSVTYARPSEVFEDNFRRPGYTMPANAPLRTPYLLMYIKKSQLHRYLD